MSGFSENDIYLLDSATDAEFAALHEILYQDDFGSVLSAHKTAFKRLHYFCQRDGYEAWEDPDTNEDLK